jgi:DNA-binding NtrC family response regulator
VKPNINILIADRNPRVLKYLHREMTGAGYQVCLAESSRQIIFWAQHLNTLDLAVIDPDFPDQEADQLMADLRSISPDLPVIIHSYFIGEQKNPDQDKVWYVEKSDNSIDSLKHAIHNILSQNPHPKKAAQADFRK